MRMTSTWAAGSNPDPDAILKDARAAFVAGRYADALAMQVWFHENALLHQRSFAGVRLSYALSDWADLAEQYPPALARLLAMRDDAAAEPTTERFGSHAMHDLVAINETLGDDENTMEVFDRIEREQPDLVRRTAFIFCRATLLRLRLYDRVLPYLRPETDLDHLIQVDDLQRELARGGHVADDHLLSYAEKSFREQSATLVALLVLGRRDEEARAIASRIRDHRSDDRIEAALAAAMKGVVPEPGARQARAGLRQRLADMRRSLPCAD